MRIDKILCPTDLSLNSATGVAYASGLARRHGAALVVLHVTSFPAMPMAALYELDAMPFERRVHVPPTVDQLLQRARIRLDAFIKTIKTHGCHTRVAFGRPAEEIVLSAE
jgi:nucleotide-binding universal stress UspA family protein